MSNILEFSDVQAGYDECTVLEGVSFKVETGRLVALLGRNGAGKTTCINVAVGFLRPTLGEVRLLGSNIAGRSVEWIARQGTGLVPQGRRVFPTLTVAENLRVAARAPKTKVNELWGLERVFDLFPRLRERSHQFAGSLSGGEQQMLVIGRALMTNPVLLLLDEPSEGLAPKIVAELKEVLLSLKTAGMAIVLVEQNSKLALDVADDALILNMGKIQVAGPARDVAQDRAAIDYHLGIF